MTAQPQYSTPVGALLPEKNLRAIRAALIAPEDLEAFDAGLEVVLDEVRVSLDLEALNTFVHRWWISACDTAKGPNGRHQMHVRARHALAGEPLPQGRPWRAVLAARGIDV